MTRPTLALWMVAAALPATMAMAASDSPASYAVSVPIMIEPAGQGLYRVPLPLALLRHLRSVDRRDLRIFNAAGEAVPIAWAGAPAAAPPAAPRKVELPRFAWPSSLPAGEHDDTSVRVELRPDGTVVRVERRGAEPRQSGSKAPVTAWLIDRSALAGEQPQALELQWDVGSLSGVCGVLAFASADARSWRSVGDANLLEFRDAASGQSIVQRRVVLRALERRETYLRLQFDRPLALQQVQAEMPPPEPPVSLESERFRPVRSAPRTWTLDTGAALPIRRLQFHLPQDNAVLPLSIARRTQAGGAAGDWAAVASHTAYRIVRNGVTVSSPPIDTGESMAREWRFMLDERIAPPEIGPDVTLWWPAVQLLFAASGPAPFRLVLGRENAAAATIDRQVLIPGYRLGDEYALPPARLGAPAEQASVAPSLIDTLRQAEPEQQRRWVLWATLSMAVVVLAVLAWRLSHDLRSGGDRPPGA